LVENKDSVRKLTPDEERLCDELNLSKKLFAGERLDDYEILREDPHSLIVPNLLDPTLPVLEQVDALELRRNLRFGNHMHALANSLLLAKSLGITEVILPENQMFRRTFEIEGILFSLRGPGDSTPDARIRLVGDFFYLKTFRPLLPKDKTTQEFMSLFGPALKLVPRFSFRECWHWLSRKLEQSRKWLVRDLTIHIRSGDIFIGAGSHPDYWQPPLSFYKSVITSTKPWQVTLVFEDRGNPVIDELERFLRRTKSRLRIVDGPIGDAFREVITARRLVVSRGSFAVPMVSISKSLRKLFIFSDAWPFAFEAPRRALTKKLSIFIVKDTAGSYKSKVSPWRNSENQRNSMLSHESDEFPTP
jgi:hypothetical protein